MRDVVVACAVLHNMLLAYDAGVVRHEADDAAFGRHDPSVLGQVIRSRDFASSSATSDVVVHEDLDVSGLGTESAPGNIPFFFHDGESEPRHYVLRNALARHLRCSDMH